MKQIYILFFLLISVHLYAQKYIEHKVKKGETVYAISQKYHTTPEAIYAMNPKAKKGIKARSWLKIPKTDTKPKLSKTIEHKVKSGETLYGISKKYQVNVKTLYTSNPTLEKEGLKAGETIVILAGKSSKTTVEPVVTTTKEGKKPSKKNKKTADKLVASSNKYLGVPYRTGGMSKSGMDCSGLMCTVYSSQNIQLPRTSITQASYGKKINLKKAQKGDLIFFKTSSKRRINHVGMIVSVNRGEIKFIHASTSRGVMVSSLNEAYYKKRFAQVNRVIN